MTYSVRLKSTREIMDRYYEFDKWDDAYRFAEIFNATETIQVKL